MKTATKLVSGSMLSAMKNAEATLARQEAKDLENGIPEGHPLRDEVEKQKAILGDLAGLPPGHPLLIAMQDAKERYEAQQIQRTGEQQKVADVKKAKKIDEDTARIQSRRAEEDKTERLRDASGKINAGINETLVTVRNLYRLMSEHEELLNMSPISRSRTGKLKRLLFAAERGLSECRIARV